MSSIEIWFDGGDQLGYGNVRRSRELGEFLINRGHAVRFMPLSDRAGALLGRDEGIADQPSLALVDVPYCGDSVVRSAHGRGLKTVALDFDGTVPPDLIISLQATRRVPNGCRFLCGAQYAIVREEIRSLGIRHAVGEEVLIVVGGGDHGGLVDQITQRLPRQRLCVVQGPAGLSTARNRDNVHVVFNPPHLPKLMACCAWAVTTGGTTMLEALCIGKAVHVVPRTMHEQAFARRFKDAGALLEIGLETLRMPSWEQIIACERRGPQLVDGGGCERIAMEIESLL